MIGEQLCATVRFQLPAVIQKDWKVHAGGPHHERAMLINNSSRTDGTLISPMSHRVQEGKQQRRQARHAGQAAQALVADGLRHRQPQPRHVRHALQRTQPRVCDLNRRILREHSRSALSGQQHVGLQCSSDTYAAAYKARGSLRAAVVASA